MRRWAVLVFVLVLSCAGPSSPREAAQGYLAALAQLDFTAAAGFVADEGRDNFQVLRGLYAGLSAEEQKKFVVTDWAITGERVNGDSATVDFTFDKVKRGQLSLKKTGGVWRVDHRRTF